MSKKTKKQTPAADLKLDFGCGRNLVSPDFQGVDLYAPDVKHKVDLFKFPLPWKDGAVSEIHCSHFVEHIPRTIRWPFFEECWRIMKDGALMKIFVPNWKSQRAYGDMTHEWPAVTAFFFFYLQQSWRETNRLTYGAYDLKCNFEAQMGPVGIHPDWAQRTPEVAQKACDHQLETYTDMWCILTKKPLA